MTVHLVNPRHPYAPREGAGYVYMPSALHTAAARLSSAGAQVELLDLNFPASLPRIERAGLGVIGCPYIPVAMELIERITRADPHSEIMLGGQVISGLSADQFTALFGARARNGNDDMLLAAWAGIDARALPQPEEVSLVRTYSEIPDEHLKPYLAAEFSLYLANGCRYRCDFCAADRTFQSPVTRVVQQVRERYRNLTHVEADLSYLTERALGFGLESLTFYLSNLDLFQTPTMLLEFANTVAALTSRYSGFSYRMRGLSTVSSFMTAHKGCPWVIDKMVEAGLERIGFGIDGATPEVWRAIHKRHNTSTDCLDAIRLAREHYNITPETLMVFGHSGVDNQQTLSLAVDFSTAMFELYGALKRPHVAKAAIPGNTGWMEPQGHTLADQLIAFPPAFQALDLLAYASPLTHPVDDERVRVNKAYRSLCESEGCISVPIEPLLPEMTEDERLGVRAHNEQRYDI